MAFRADSLKPKVTKLGRGEERLEFANGDEFTGVKQDDNTHNQSLPHFSPSGLGTYSAHKSGYIYSGNFDAGRLVGEGKVTSAQGDIIEGTWHSDGSCQGTVRYSAGHLYTGSLLHNQLHGFGVLELKFGARYEVRSLVCGKL